ncbi:FecR family protein [Caenispirillum bisanense]|uniref:FecR family protein n=1 Tax=Caenispirillum bisanense TaxID=414052 RepID=UPI0031D558C9
MSQHPTCPGPAPMPDTAAAWQVALREAPDDAALLAAHVRWLAADPAHRQEWQDMQRVWRLLGESSLAAAPSPQPQHGPPRRWPLAAALAMAACLTLAVLTPDALLHLQADAVTASGETRRLDLPDGSRLDLAPDSAVSLAQADAPTRQVTLLRGTAFFEVAPQAGRPFQVRAGEVTTTVLGTAFEVSRQGDGVRVTVEHGRVRVAPPGATVELTAGEAATADGSGGLSRSSGPPALVAAWRRGQLVVRDRPVSEVVAELDTYMPGWVVVTDGDLGRRTVTGFFDLSQPEAALEAVAASHGAVVQRVTPWLRLVKPAA